MKHYTDVVQNPLGQALAGASITVYLAGTLTLASLFSDDGVTATTNPVQTDANGRFAFYVADGRYDLNISGLGIITFTLKDIEIADITQSSPSDSTANFFNVNVSGTLTLAGSPTISGNTTFSGNNSFTGNNTFSGVTLAKNFESVRYCDQFPGADIGAQCNAAIADFGAAPACGTVVVPAGSFTYTSGINIVSRNGCVFRGMGKTQTKLNYTGSGTAFTIDNSASGLGEFAMYNLTLDGTGSSGATGFWEKAGYWALLEDVDITSFSVDCKFDGNHANGTNVIALIGVRCYNASTTAIWLTGPNLTGQGTYNFVMYGGQANCSSTSGTTGILIDGKSTNNKFDFPLINNCGTGVHDSSIGNNTFRDISVQGNTQGVLLDASVSSDLFDGGYYFSNTTPFTDNGTDNVVVNDGVNGAGTYIHQPFRASPYRGGGAESNFTADLNGTNIRLCSFSITGGGTWYPMCLENRNSGHLSIMRADAQALPAFGGTLTNYQPVFDVSPLGVATFSDNTGTAKATIDNTGKGTFNGFATGSNCAVNSVSPAACGSAASGAFVVPTTTTNYTVNTTAVTATSRIFLQPRTNTGDLPGSPTCVSVAGGSPYSISAQSAGTSFTFGLPSTTGQTCWNYWIIN